MKHISVDEIKKMVGSEGLILQGCGGDPTEWLNGINETLTEAGILQNGGAFKNISVFEHDGVTNILFPFDDVSSETLNMGKLAMWRLQTHETFGGTWLSDYLPNKLGISTDAPQVENEEDLSAPENKEFDVENSANEAPEQKTSPFHLYIENIHDSSIGGFTIPLPTTLEELQPFLDGAEISGWQDMKIFEPEAADSSSSSMNKLAERLSDIVYENPTPHTFNELNYLAARVQDLWDNGLDIFNANIEAGRNCASIAEIINLTFDENLNRFDVMPAFDANMYGEFLVETLLMDENHEAFYRLRNSAEPSDNKLADYIEKLESNVNHAALGKAIAKEENGIFTKIGLLTGGDGLQTIYQGSQDIPLEYGVLHISDEARRPLLKVSDVNISEALVKLHAVTGNHAYTSNSLKMLTSGKGNEYLLAINSFGVRLFELDEAYKHGSGVLEVFLENMKEFGGQYRTFAIQLQRGKSDDNCAFTGEIAELNAKALISNIERHAAAPNRMDVVHADDSKKTYDLFAWADVPHEQRLAMKSRTLRYPESEVASAVGHYNNFRRENKCQSAGINELLSSVNAPYMTEAENPQPDMLRIGATVAREILARGDVDVFKLTPAGAEQLSVIDALRPSGFSEIKETAIKTADANHLDKWAQTTAKDIVRKLEKQERSEKNKNDREEI